MNILIAHPSSKFRRLLAERLHEVPGAEVVGQAGHENEAVMAASLSRPNVLLLDIALASGDGLSLVQRMREAGFSGVAYAVTAADETVVGPQCVAAGLDGFYHQDLELDQLITALKVLTFAPMSFEQMALRPVS